MTASLRVAAGSVVGAGLAGLARALDVRRAGRRVALPEASGGPGGRMRTDRRGGVRVPDIRPGLLDTGVADRAMVATHRPWPLGSDPREAGAAVADALAPETDLLRRAPNGTPVVGRRAR